MPDPDDPNAPGVIKPQDPATPAPLNQPNPDLVALENLPQLTPGMSNPQPAAPAPQLPTMTPGMSNPQPTTMTTTDVTTTTEGMAEGDKANITQQGEAAAASKDRQAAAVEARGEQQAQAQTDAAMQDARRQAITYFQVGSEMAKTQAVHDETRAALEAAAKFRPERKKTFQSDNAFDVIVTVLGAMASGWVQGVRGGGNAFMDSLNKMIEDDLDDQVRSNSEYLRELRSRLGSHDAALLELKARMKEASAEFFEARDLVNAAPNAKVEAQLVAEKLRGEASELRMKAAKDVADKKRTVVARKQHLVKPAGSGVSPQDKAKAGRNLRQLNRISSTLRRAQQSGALAKVIGLVDKPISAAQRATFGLDPAQEEALTALEDLQVDNLMRIVREPNNKQTQDMVQRLGIAQSDSAIPIMLQRLDELIQAENDAYAGVAPQAPAGPTGTF